MITYEEFVNKLEKNKIEYTLLRFYSATYVEVGRYGYRFDGQDKSTGGWIHNCAEDWEAEWEEWAALLK